MAAHTAGTSFLPLQPPNTVPCWVTNAILMQKAIAGHDVLANVLCGKLPSYGDVCHDLVADAGFFGGILNYRVGSQTCPHGVERQD